MIVHTLSGDILISECSTWNLRLKYPKVRSIIEGVDLWARLNCSSDWDCGYEYGVNRNGEHA